jgi:Fe-S-cluster-containing hydrogenase component 2
MKTQKTPFILVDAEKCTACGLCQMACSMVYHGILSPHRARIRVLRFEGGGGNVPLVCQACEDAPASKRAR